MADPEIYMAVTDFVDHRSGAPIPVRKGATARAGHEIVKAFPTMWVPLAVDYEVEEALSEAEQLNRLRPEAVQLGVNVDGRWSAARLRKEIDKAKAEA